MPEIVASILSWLVPALVVFGVTAIALTAIFWAVRRARRSPRARAAAEAERTRAGVALVALDDAIEEADLEVELSGALYGGDAPPSLRRARMTAQHARDQAFEDYRSISSDAAALPQDIERTSARIRSHADQALGVIARARAEHTEWVRRNVTARDQVTGATRRLAGLRESMGDPGALVSDLSNRFDESEWKDAATAANAAVTQANAAARLLATAAERADDPSRTALPELAQAERALRGAQSEARTLEERHRLVTQASAALPGEFEAAHAALRQARVTREGLEPVDADRLGTAIREADAALTALEPQADRRPTATIDAIARIRDRLDMALGDARTAQQRLRGARTALPGTVAAARNAIAQAEASVAHAHAGADARVRLAAAQAELAGARQSQDPVEALDAARRAMRHAEDAQALAAYERLGGL